MEQHMTFCKGADKVVTVVVALSVVDFYLFCSSELLKSLFKVFGQQLLVLVELVTSADINLDVEWLR